MEHNATIKLTRVLLVEDDRNQGPLMKSWLEKRGGYIVDLAIDGTQGVNMAVRGGYDLVISDIVMPRAEMPSPDGAGSVSRRIAPMAAL
jgi:CheY-like chemotaxis protein